MNREPYIIKSTAGQVAAELARRGVLPQERVRISLEPDDDTSDFVEQKDDHATGQALIEALQASPYREVDIEPPRFDMQIREVAL